MTADRDATDLYRIGGAAYATLQAAFDAARPGDVVELSGVVRGEAAVLRTPGVTLRGPAMFEGLGASRALIVARAPGLVVEQIEAADAPVPGGGGIFVLLETEGELTLRSCHVHDAQTAVGVARGMSRARILLENCVLERIDSGLDIGRVAELRIRGGRYTAGITGPCVRSRAAKTLIEGAQIHEGIACSIALPEGGEVEIAGCSIVRAQAGGAAEAVSYGSEGRGWPDNAFHFYASNSITLAGAPAEPAFGFRFEPDVKVVEGPRSADPAPPKAVGDGKVTPAFDSSGRVLDRWWAGLPLNAWVEVLGTDPGSNIGPLLPEGFRDFGVLRLAGVFHAWCGAAFDGRRGKMFFNGGGHNDSSNNGLYEFDLERMKWRIAMQPSLYTQEDVNHSKSAWDAYAVSTKNSNNKWLGWNLGYEPPTDYWKDGKPTAVHTYRSLEWCEENQRVLRAGQRHFWQYDPATGGFSRGLAQTVISNNSSVYDPATRKWYVFYCDIYRYQHYRIYEPLADRISNVLVFQTHGTPGVTPVIVGRKIFLFQDSGVQTPVPDAWTLDLDNGAVEDVPLVDHPERTQDGPKSWKTHAFNSCGDYARATRKFYALHKHTGSGQWGSFTTVDPSSGRCAVYTPAGRPPPAGGPSQPSPYSKFRIYERKNGTFMLLFHLAGANLHIVRIA